MNFSVLISAYRTEEPIILDRALKSIWDDQILKPDQIVLIKDGPLGLDLDKILEKWLTIMGSSLDIVYNPVNLGLGDSLRKGIHHCKYDLIARMDTDDISVPSRFVEQINFLKNNPEVDILGSNISEFANDEMIQTSFRKVPSTHENIIENAKIQCPFNHPSVFFKKKAYLNAAGPKNLFLMDDWYVWVLMIMNGAICANIDKDLVKMRGGSDQMSRRGGWIYLFQSLKLQKLFYDIKFINLIEFLRNSAILITVSLVPPVLRYLMYKYLIRRLNFNRA